LMRFVGNCRRKDRHSAQLTEGGRISRSYVALPENPVGTGSGRDTLSAFPSLISLSRWSGPDSQQLNCSGPAPVRDVIRL
jgi:hypothetical protein